MVNFHRRVVISHRQNREICCDRSQIFDPPTGQHGDRQRQQNHIARRQPGPGHAIAIDFLHRTDFPDAAGMKLFALPAGAACGVEIGSSLVPQKASRPRSKGRVRFLVGQDMGFFDHRKQAEVVERPDPGDIDSGLFPKLPVKRVGLRDMIQHR